MTMEDKHKELLCTHRRVFTSHIDADKLLPLLEKSNVFDGNDLVEISRQATNIGRVEKILDILPTKSTTAFQKFCVALENTYPNLLTMMFLGDSQNTEDAAGVSLPSDADRDVRHSPLLPTCGIETSGTGMTTYTRIIPSYEYDLQADTQTSAPLSIDEASGFSDLSTVHFRIDGFNAMSLSQTDISKDYDWLKTQCEKAMTELQTLKRQHSESIKRCEQSTKEADYYRNKYKTALTQLEQESVAVNDMRDRYDNLLTDKSRVEQELIEIKKAHDEDKQEMENLRHEQRTTVMQSDNNEVLKNMCDNALDKYDARQADYDLVRSRYSAVMSEYTAAARKIDQLQEEIARVNKQNDELTKNHNALVIERNGLKKHCEEVVQERNMVAAERNSFKQHCASLSRSWDMAVLERTKLKDALAKITLHRDEVLQQLNNSMHGHIRVKHDMAQAEEERNAVLHEYSLVMSERDGVHKEIEQLQEQLQQAVSGADMYKIDLQKLQNENESLRREIECALQDRDRGMKECNQLREKCNATAMEKDTLQKERDEFMNDYIIASKERDVARKEKHEAIEYRDKVLRETFEKTQQAKLAEIDLVSKEVEQMTKQIEKLQKEVVDAHQETEIAKKRRDWAFSERDKIVQERDSIRMLCDKLRHERDRSISDLAQAIRDSDDVKKKQQEASQKLKTIQELYNALKESNNADKTPSSTDESQDWDTITLHLNIGGMTSTEVGFDLVTGAGDSQNNNALLVSRIRKPGPVDGSLRLNDVIVKVNSVSTHNVDKGVVYRTIFNSSRIVALVVKRKRCESRTHCSEFDMLVGKEIGLQLHQGLYVTWISPTSVVGRDLNVGERLVSVDGRSVEGMSTSDVLHAIRQSGDSVKLEMWKGTVHSPTISLSPPCTPTSSHKDRSYATSDSNRSSLKNMRCNGSQTDSLNSPLSDRRKEARHGKDAQSRNKSNRSLESSGDAVKHKTSGHLFDKVHKIIFGESKDSVGKITEDDVIAEFDSVLKTYEEPSDKKGQGMTKGERRSMATCHGGTWPKQQHLKIDPPSHSGTITAQQTPRRPQLPSSFMPSIHAGAVYHKVPPQPPERTDSSFAASIRHSPQNSDSSVRYTSTHQHKSMPFMNQSASRTSTPSYLNKSGPIIVDERAMHRHSAFEPGLNQTRTHVMSLPTQDKSSTIADDMSVKSSNDNRVINEHVQRIKSRNNVLASPPPLVVNTPSLAMIKSRPNSILHPAKKTNDFGIMKHINKLGNTIMEVQDINCMTSVTGASAVSGVSSVSGASAVSSLSSTSPSNPVDTIPMAQSDSKHHDHTAANVTSWCQAPHTPAMISLDDSVRPPPSPRYSSPPDVLLEMINAANSDNTFSPVSMQSVSPCPSQMSTSMIETSTRVMHDDYNYPRHYQRTSPYSRPLSEYIDGRSTIPRRGHERIRIPSNASITPKSSVSKISTGSAEIVSGHSSPLASFMPIDSTGRTSVNSLISPIRDLARSIPVQPKIGETRHINIEKTSELVGLQIDTGHSGGIFVSAVSEHSLAEQAGVVIGDQLLEFCGINMRNATKDLATSVLRQAREDFDMLVQFNPDKYYERRDSTPIMTRSLNSHLANSADRLRCTPMSTSAMAALDNCDSVSSASSTEHCLASSSRRSSELNGILSPDNRMTMSDHPLLARYERMTAVHHVMPKSDRQNVDVHLVPRSEVPQSEVPRSEVPRSEVPRSEHQFSPDIEARVTNAPSGAIPPDHLVNVSRSGHQGKAMPDHRSMNNNNLNDRRDSDRGERHNADHQRVHASTDNRVVFTDKRDDNHQNVYTALPQRDSNNDDKTLTRKTPRDRTSPGHQTRVTRSHHVTTDKNLWMRKHVAGGGNKSMQRANQQSPINVHSPVVSSPRVVYIEKDPDADLGITIIGGNAVGIFVHMIESAGHEGLQQGDHILEFNGVSLRSMTLEEATIEIRKSCSKVSLIVQRNSLRYKKVCQQRGGGDHFYMRTHFEHHAEHDGELSFKQDDILLVEDTQHDGKQGVWFAWLLGDDRRKIKAGTIPSKLRLDDEFAMRQSLTDSLHDDDFRNRRSTGPARRSFFRRKKHQRNNSKDSHEFSSVSDASLNSDSAPLIDDVPFCAYTKVEQADQSVVRPVVILAPLAEPLINKLTAESPDKYSRVAPVVMKSSAQVMENGINNSVFVHYWTVDDHYECITVSAVKEICDKKCHCLLNVPPSAIENLQKARIYPVVIFCQHKSIKQIREVKDAQFQPERLPNKAARDLMDHYQRIEQDYKHLFSGSIQGGNLAEMVTQIKRIIHTEQQRTLWVPVSDPAIR